MRASRVDTNQADIVDAFRAHGCTVLHLHSVGGGCPDLLVGYYGENYLVEIKTLKGKLNKLQQLWHEDWLGAVDVVHSIEEAERLVHRWTVWCVP